MSERLAVASKGVLGDLCSGRAPDPDALSFVMRQLRSRVERLFPDLDADEIVQATIVRLVEHPAALARSDIHSPWAYLVAATRFAALDALRTRRRRAEVDLDIVVEHTGTDDAVAALLDRDATHHAIVAAMQTAIAAKDDRTVPIITSWLDLADELGRAPSTREVAARAEVSHTTVAQALKHFRELLAQTSRD